MWKIPCGTQYMGEQDTFERLRLELRRGAIVLAVLAQLKNEHYGYSLRKALQSVGIEIDEGTLYPLVRRLESQGLLVSEWREEGKRKKRFYRISSEGADTLSQLTVEWRQLNESLVVLLEETENGHD